MEYNKGGSHMNFVYLYDVTTAEHKENTSLYFFWDIKILKTLLVN